ncbi:PEP-CTERM sorting domain-containing protein [Nitrosomonas sp.]|uniref:PEP-CTERM sorting domain-containing protein n=1 Tax=Nitrosomonas sp. TaxID=42353 RepID=UPI00374D5620
MKKNLIVLSLLVTSGLVTETASANPITSDLPSSTYVVKDSLAWTWASPVNVQHWISNELFAPSFHSGWRYATPAEMLHMPTLEEFGFGAINSAAYWNSAYTHVDAFDFAAGHVSSRWGHDVWDTFYVSSIPEPETYAMLLVGLGLLNLLARRRAERVL